MAHHLSRISVLALTAALPFAGQAAAQACSPASPSDGDTVICSGTGVGIVDDGLDELSVNVLPGANVNGGDDPAFEVDDDLTLTNDGAISSNSESAIIVDKRATITNNGTITSLSDRGIDGDDDAVIVNTGTIAAAGDGINVNDNATITNTGTITGDDAIQVGNAATVTNSGTIVASGDGIKADGDATVINDGTITAEDEGMQFEGDTVTVINNGTITATDKGIAALNNATITNNGTIISATEGIETEDDAVVVNNGAIYSSDDGINVGENATVTNYGLIEVDGNQDGIDIDSGLIVNYGTITALGTEDAIDFDPSVNASTITNHGTLTGYIGIETDAEDTGAQSVLNYGTITGTSGLAINLGQGDDTLELFAGSIINGTVNLGAGEDTLVVHAVDAGQTVIFDTAPETVDMSDAPAYALYSGTTLAVAQPRIFADLDTLSGRVAYNMAAPVLSARATQGWWAVAKGYSENSKLHGNFALGYDLADSPLGVFLTYGTQNRDVEDGVSDIGYKSYLIGLRSGYDTSGTSRIGGMAFVGRGTSSVNSPVSATGHGSIDSTIYGLAGQLDMSPARNKNVLLTARAGISREHFDSFTVTGLGGASFATRDVTSSYIGFEAGLTRALSAGLDIRPFIGANLLDTDGDRVTMVLGDASTTFDTGGTGRQMLYSAGTDFSIATSTNLTGRIEMLFDENGNADGAVTLWLAF